MQQFIMLVGLPGCGKSTIAQKLIEQFTKNTTPYAYESSDAIRGEIYGDENCQDNPANIFELMEKRTIKALEEGRCVIYDATNIKRKNRVHLLSTLHRKFPDISYVCKIVWARVDTCIERAKNRDRVVPEEVIYKMLKQWNTPTWEEGFDEVEICLNDDRLYSYEDYNLNTPHDNSHHKADKIIDHIARVQKAVDKWFDEQHQPVPVVKYELFKQIAKYHDIGKPLVKEFKDSRGNDSDQAHYYNHQNVGAYLVLGDKDCGADPTANPPKLYCIDKVSLSKFIELHMEPFFHKQPSKEYTSLKADVKELVELFNRFDREGA